jgi:hypothetical protein
MLYAACLRILSRRLNSPSSQATVCALSQVRGSVGEYGAGPRCFGGAERKGAAYESVLTECGVSWMCGETWAMITVFDGWRDSMSNIGYKTSVLAQYCR